MSLLFRNNFSGLGSFLFIFSLGFGTAFFLTPQRIERVSANEKSQLAMTLVNPANDRLLVESTEFSSLDQRMAQVLTAQEKRLQNDNLAEFRRNQDREYQLRKEEIMSHRKTCNKQVDGYTKDRKVQRESLRKTCMPGKSMVKPASAVEAQEQRKAQQQKNAECIARLRSFDTDTRVQLVTLRKSCYDTERGVLGLSTEAPMEQ